MCEAGTGSRRSLVDPCSITVFFLEVRRGGCWFLRGLVGLLKGSRQESSRLRLLSEEGSLGCCGPWGRVGRGNKGWVLAWSSGLSPSLLPNRPPGGTRSTCQKGGAGCPAALGQGGLLEGERGSEAGGRQRSAGDRSLCMRGKVVMGTGSGGGMGRWVDLCRLGPGLAGRLAH